MGIFSKGGFNMVVRQTQVLKIASATSFKIPAYAKVRRIYAQNRTATTSNLTVGNAAAGAQYLASTAVPTGTGTAPGMVAAQAIDVAISKVESEVHITLSAYAAGGIDVVVEFDEYADSLPLPRQQVPASY